MMFRLALLHRDLSCRISSLKQIVEECRLQVPQGAPWDKCSIDLNPNTSQLTIKSVRRRRKCLEVGGDPVHNGKLQITQKPQESKPSSVSNQLDEGFESDVDTISLVSTESAISLLAKNHETDSANGSASSDSDDSDHNKSEGAGQRLQDGRDFRTSGLQGLETLQNTVQRGQITNPEGKNTDTETVTEHVNLVNCVCYKAEENPDILILIANEETLIFQFENPRQLDIFHENFSTVKAVSSQRTFPQRHFNLLQRTDSNGMTHIRISRQESEEFASMISLPTHHTSAKDLISLDKQFATLGKPQRRRQVLKKSKSIEDLLDLEEKPLRKVWTSVENILNDERPKAPPRRKKGPAPLPPSAHHQPSHTINKSFSSPNIMDGPSLSNVFQGQFVRVQVDQHRPLAKLPVMTLPFKQKIGTPEVIKYEPVDLDQGHKTLKNQRTVVRNFDAFKFSDPKNLTGYQVLQEQDREMRGTPDKAREVRGFSSLKLYIPKYRSKKIQNGIPGGSPIQNSGTFTNRLFGMSAKLKEFSSLQSHCNPNRRYEANHVPNCLQGQFVAHYQDERSYQNPYGCPNVVRESGRFSLGKFGRLGKSGSLGNLTLLAQAEKGHDSSTLKSVIKKKTRDEEDWGRKPAKGGNGKKVTFSAYNTVQVV